MIATSLMDPSWDIYPRNNTILEGQDNGAQIYVYIKQSLDLRLTSNDVQSRRLHYMVLVFGERNLDIQL